MYSHKHLRGGGTRAHSTTRAPLTRLLPLRRLVIVGDADAKIHVPSDGFNGLSPERKASNMLRTLFTFCAAKSILAQLEGSGRGSLGSFNAPQYEAIQNCLLEVPMKDGDAWLRELAKRDKLAATRVCEVREVYASNEDVGFEWHQLRKIVDRDMKAQNLNIMREAIMPVLTATAEGEDGTSEGSDDGERGKS